MNRSTNYVRISRIKLLASVVVLTAMVTGWWRLTSASPVTLAVEKMVPRDRETELVSEDDEWSSGFVEATLVLANTSDRPIFYQGVMDAANVEHVCLWQEGSGWRGGGESCGLSLSSYTLQPSQSVTFTALLLPESICKGQSIMRMAERLARCGTCCQIGSPVNYLGASVGAESRRKNLMPASLTRCEPQNGTNAPRPSGMSQPGIEWISFRRHAADGRHTLQSVASSCPKVEAVRRAHAQARG